MPAAPEVLHAMGKERLAEINHKVKAEQLRATARDVAVAAEVSVNLPGKPVGSKQNDPEVGRTQLAAKCGVHQQRAIVRNDTFPNQSGENQHQAIEETIRLEDALLLDLRQ